MRLRSTFNILNVILVYSFLFLALSLSTSKAGTADFGGGGNGSQNKVYESNIKPLIKLSIYNKYIKPRLEKFDILMAQLGQSEEKNNFSYSQFLIRMKSWYFTEDTLKSIDKETLGIIFNEDKTQQIALNKKKEIWIDNKIFSNMQEQHQADLIMHEIVMNLYFLKFYSFYDICNIGKEMGLYDEKEENNLSCEQIKNIKYFQAKQSMVLQEDDYQNIRRVTSWFINDLLNASADDLFNKLRYNDFDKRLITKSNSKKEIRISGREIENLLLKLHHTDNFPDTCKSSITNEDKNCSITIQKTSNSYGPDFNKLEFQIQEGNKVNKISFNISNRNSIFTSPLQSSDGLNYFSISFKSNDAPLVLTDTVGDRFYYLALYLTPTKGTNIENVQLLGYSLVPLAITSINQTKDNSIYADCEVGRLNLKKHPAYSWGADDRSESLIDFTFNLTHFSKFYCTVRSQETIDKIRNSKSKIDDFMKDQLPQLSKIIGKKFEFVSTSTYSGANLNSLKKSYEINSTQKDKSLEECNEQESKNNRKCSVLKTLKLINEETILVDNKFTCNLIPFNYYDYNMDSNVKFISDLGVTFSVSCQDSNLVLQTSSTGRFYYNNGLLRIKGDAYLSNNNFYQSESIYKEIP